MTATAHQDFEGFVLPAPVAGHPGLELCNTIAGWGEEATFDYLHDYEHVASLAAALDLIDRDRMRALLQEAAAHPGAARQVLAETRRFRASLYAVLTRDRPDDKDVDRVSRTFAAAAAARRLDKVGPWGSRWVIPEEVGLRTPLLALAWEARALVESDEHTTVGRCPGSECGWLFTNPSGRRRWCVMSICGNRAKARRFAERHAAS